ncbi:MAG: hypothetical protein AB1806_18340 [Acidobacteriota bacterium]
MNTSAPPYLSIVLTGRNDNYGGDFNERFFRALRFNHTNLAAHGVDHEVVFVEWSPLAGRPHLSDLLAAEFSDLAATALTCYVVDPRYQDELSLNPSIKYLEYLAKNVGLRRATGRFVLSTNTDVFFGESVVASLASGRLEAGTVYRAPRFDLKLGIDQSHVSWEMLDDERNQTRRGTLAPPLLSGAAGDFLLADRESVHRLKGFNEVYRLARVGIDVNFLVKAYGAGLRMADIGGPVYHVDHIGSHRSSKSLYDDSTAPWGRGRWHARTASYDNPHTWGLAEAPQVEVGPRTFRIDFDWAAMPPLVELRRVVLPVRRVGQADAGGDA